ncbi:MAG: class I adenylate-forming enzyme family protein [Alphaproteobacteria bacterium]
MNKHRIEATTLGDLLLKAADRHPNRDAMVFPDSRRTYAELSERAYARARSLIAMGVRPGDHVGMLMPNCMVYVELLLGCVLTGAVAVPINARFKAHEMGYVIENADLVALFTTDMISEYADFAEVLNTAFPDLKDQTDPAQLHLDSAPKLKSVVMYGDSQPPGFMAFDAFETLSAQALNEDVDANRVMIMLSDPCIMMYTSGTTANPKGCPLTHENLVRSGINMNRERYFMTPEDRFWDPLPIFHMSFILPMMACFDAGAALLSMTHFEAGAAIRMMVDEKATIAFPAFPTIMTAIIDHPDFKTADLSRVRRLNNVAPPDTMRLFQNAFPQAVQTAAFGLTEVSGVVSFGHPDDPEKARLEGCGRPFAGTEVSVVDFETREPLPAGERGEIRIRGYCVFPGYYKDPEKTAECFEDGWFCTGDLCSVDEDGFIYFHGRLKDMLKVGGENVAAVEIESYLSNHPAVKLAQVVGVPDPRLQEVAAAFIELKDGAAATEQEIIDFCKSKIASFKVPRHVRFVTEWPMSSTKVQKFKLREDFLAEAEAAA